MMIPKLDRYIFKEMIPPFFLGLALLSLYILLNLMVLLADLMLDRDIAWEDLFRALAYRLPELVVVSLPISMLFTVFLTFGRLKHDRELIALQASGVSLKRTVVPVVVFSIMVSFVTLAINEYVVPWSTQQYNRMIRSLVASGSALLIQENVVFKDPTGRFFYVKRYDKNTNEMRDVIVMDPHGQSYLPQVSGGFPVTITSTHAEWNGEVWTLHNGIAHAFDAGGNLTDKVGFERLEINVGDTISNIFVDQRTPREMSLRELGERIQKFQEAGQSVSDLVVEYQIKLVIPLAALMYALFAAPVSLGFGFRGRAAGIIVSILLTGTFQGALFYAQTLSRRQLLWPDWGPWLPNIFFGLLGIILILNVDKLSRMELGRWFQKASAILIFLGMGVTGFAQEAPLPFDMKAKAIETSRAGDFLLAQGDVEVHYGEQTIQAQELQVIRISDTHWRLEATREVQVDDPGFSGQAEFLNVLLDQTSGEIRPTQIALSQFIIETGEDLGGLRYQANQGVLTFSEQLDSIQLDGDADVQGEGFSLQADNLTVTNLEESRWRVDAKGDVQFEGSLQQVNSDNLKLTLVLSGDEPQLEDITLSDFYGEGSFVNAVGEEHDIRYQGENAQFSFEEQTPSRLELGNAKFTTCTCAGTIEQASYSFSGRELIWQPDEWILGRDLTLKTSGFPVFWLPLFWAPLKEIEGSELFPNIGRDVRRGWFAQWRLPVFVNPQNRGTFLLDYYNRYTETGFGVDWNYTFDTQSQSGKFGIYHFVGQNQVLDLNWNHRWPISSLANLSWSLTRKDVTPKASAPSRWAYQMNLSGQAAGWQWRVNTVRDEVSQEEEADKEGEEKKQFRVLERLPELSLSNSGKVFDLPFSYSGQVGWGHFREQRGETEPFTERDRLNSSASLSLNQIQLQTASLRFGASANVGYAFYGEDTQRTNARWQVDATWQPSSALSTNLRYFYQAVQGNSPFVFDEVQVADKLTGQVQFSLPPIRGTLSTGYALQTGQLDPLTLSMNAVLGEHKLQGTLRTVANGFDLEAIQLQDVWTAPWGELTLQGGYLPRAQRYEDLIARLSLDVIRLGARIDLNQGRLRRTNAQFDLRLGRWSLDFSGEFDWFQNQFSALQVGMVHHFCNDCWQAGLYLSRQRIWLEVQINAFPEAALNYSPTDGELSFN